MRRNPRRPLPVPFVCPPGTRKRPTPATATRVRLRSRTSETSPDRSPAPWRQRKRARPRSPPARVRPPAPPLPGTRSPGTGPRPGAGGGIPGGARFFSALRRRFMPKDVTRGGNLPNPPCHRELSALTFLRWGRGQPRNRPPTGNRARSTAPPTPSFTNRRSLAREKDRLDSRGGPHHLRRIAGRRHGVARHAAGPRPHFARRPGRLPGPPHPPQRRHPARHLARPGRCRPPRGLAPPPRTATRPRGRPPPRRRGPAPPPPRGHRLRALCRRPPPGRPPSPSRPGEPARARHRPPPPDPALLIYTSGTTGRPKGVLTTHANITAQITALTAAWAWTGRDRILHTLPLHHIHGLINALACALWSGAAVEFGPGAPTSTWERLASGGITLFMAVPTVYTRLIRAWERQPRPCGNAGRAAPPASPHGVRVGGASRPHPRAVARDHRPHPPRALRNDRNRHGAVQPAHRRAPPPVMSVCRSPASRCASSTTAAARLPTGPHPPAAKVKSRFAAPRSSRNTGAVPEETAAAFRDRLVPHR